MRTRTILAAPVLFLAGLALCLAADAHMGTWKLNEAKSKFSPGAQKNMTVVYEAAGENTKVTVDGVDKDGKPTHQVWVGKFDGKDYPVTGEANYDSRSYTKVDDHTMDMTIKMGGKVVATGKITVAADGKSRTVTTKGTDPKATALNATAVYDKQ
jgi:formylglycine-generating enzyme required for sulfatase activity